MSADANTAVVQEMFAAFQRGDLDQVLAMQADDVEWWSGGPPEVPYAGLYRGREGVRRFLGELDDTIAYERWEPQEFIAAGDTVVVIGEERWRAKPTGNLVENPWVIVIEVRDGKVRRFRNYEDTAAVLSGVRSAP